MNQTRQGEVRLVNWRLLGLWAGLLTSILLAQRLTVGTFETGRWEGGRLTPATPAELLWYKLPVIGVVLVTAACLIAGLWRTRRKRTCVATCVWGFVLSALAVLASLAMSAYYYLNWYMD